MDKYDVAIFDNVSLHGYRYFVPLLWRRFRYRAVVFAMCTCFAKGNEHIFGEHGTASTAASFRIRTPGDAALLYGSTLSLCSGAKGLPVTYNLSLFGQLERVKLNSLVSLVHQHVIWHG